MVEVNDAAEIFRKVIAEPSPLDSGPGATYAYESMPQFESADWLWVVAEDRLSTWKQQEKWAVRQLVLRNEDKPEPNLAERCPERETQIEQLVEVWGEHYFEHRHEAYAWFREGLQVEPHEDDRSLPHGILNLLEEIEADLAFGSNSDLRTCLKAPVAKLKLRYLCDSLHSEIETNRTEWALKFGDYDSGRDNSQELAGWVANIEHRWLRLALGARLVENWRDPLHVLAYRWEYNWWCPVNFLREGVLAGIRLWCERVSELPAHCTAPNDFQSIAKLARQLFAEVRPAHTAEAPSTHLGQKDADLVALTFPIFSGYIAETEVTDAQLDSDWAALSADERSESDDSFDCYVEDRRFGCLSTHGEISLSSRPITVDCDSACRAICVRFCTRVVEEAGRFGRTGFADPRAIKDEREAIEFVELVVSDVVAFGRDLPNSEDSSGVLKPSEAGKAGAKRDGEKSSNIENLPRSTPDSLKEKQIDRVPSFDLSTDWGHLMEYLWGQGVRVPGTNKVEFLGHLDNYVKRYQGERNPINQKRLRMPRKQGGQFEDKEYKAIRQTMNIRCKKIDRMTQDDSASDAQV